MELEVNIKVTDEFAGRGDDSHARVGAMRAR
jgi:hypothetical protein